LTTENRTKEIFRTKINGGTKKEKPQTRQRMACELNLRPTKITKLKKNKA
jgi:hypothetical protein